MPSSSSSVSIPAPLRNWLKSQYPTLLPKDVWLQQTISSYHGPRSAADGKLIEYVHEALLGADLQEVADRSVLGALADLKAGREGVLGAGPRGAVLLQVVGKLDIGVSAQTQLDVLEARRAARSSLTGSNLLLEESAQGSGAGSSVQRSAQARQDQEQLDPEHGDHMTEFNAAEEAATLPATVFPRSMLQLQLSDGFTTVVGFEHRRVPGLSMADTPLGAKLLLRDVRYNKGKLFLDPRGVIVKGGQVAALELDAEEKLMDHLREKLGKPPLERRSGRASGNARTQSAANGSTTRPTDNTAAPAPRAATSISAGPSSSRRAQPQEQEQGPPSSFDEAQFEEDEAMWAELQEEQEAMRKASVAAPRAPVRPASTTLRPAVAGASSISRRVERVAPEDKVDDAPLPPSPSPSSSPPQRPSNRKKFKPLQPSSSVSPPPRAGKRPRPQLGRGMVDDEEDLEEEGKEHFSRSARDVPRDGYEDAVGASFFAEGMSDEDGYGNEVGGTGGRVKGEGEGDGQDDFMILERNDRGNPIVLSDSE